MTDGVKVMSLGDDFGELIIGVNHARIPVHADGRVETEPVSTEPKGIAPAVPVEPKPGE